MEYLDLVGAEKFPRNVHDILGKVRGGLRDVPLDSRDTCKHPYIIALREQ